jgi:hypothetical protein
MAMLPDKELRIDPLAMTDVYTEKPPHAKAYTAYALATMPTLARAGR